MEGLPKFESNNIDSIQSEIERVLGINVLLSPLEKTDTKLRFQLLEKKEYGKPMSKEQHEQFKNLFVKECVGVDESNISLETTPFEATEENLAGDYVNLVIDLDKPEATEVSSE